jgi:hypothetical protein
MTQEAIGGVFDITGVTRSPPIRGRRPTRDGVQPTAGTSGRVSPHHRRRGEPDGTAANWRESAHPKDVDFSANWRSWAMCQLLTLAAMAFSVG